VVLGSFGLSSCLVSRAASDILGMRQEALFQSGLRIAWGDLVRWQAMQTAPSERITSEIKGRCGTILMDLPWRFANRAGKVGPEHKRLHRYQTLSFEEIASLPVPDLSLPRSHPYLWCPNALLVQGLSVVKASAFTYDANHVRSREPSNSGRPKGLAQPNQPDRGLGQRAN
jgi:hypothetical protein